MLAEDEFDCTIAFGFDPWAIETVLHRLPAKRRLLYLCRPLQHYIGEQDRQFFCEALHGCCGILFESQEAADAAEGFLNGTVSVQKIGLPCDIQRIQALADADEDVGFEDECINLVAVYSQRNEEWMEHLPALAAGLKQDHPNLRWHVLGTGKRYERMTRNIILQDVWQEVVPEGDVENVYPYLRRCDAFLQMPGDKNSTLVREAQAMGKAVIEVRACEGSLKLVESEFAKGCLETVWIPWEDQNEFMKMIEGE